MRDRQPSERSSVPIRVHQRSFQDKIARITQQDCVTGMQSLPAGSVDVIVTSPPYNLGVDYNTYNDSMPREQYKQWTEEWARAAQRVLSQDGSLFLNIAGKPVDPWVPFDVASCFRPLFHLQNVIHWVKSISITETASAPQVQSAPPVASRNGTNTGHGAIEREDAPVVSRGHFKPIQSKRYLNDCHEYIFHFTRTGRVPIDRLAIGVPYQDKSNIKRWNSPRGDLRCRGNTWFIPYDTIVNRERERPHPATFPPRLPMMCIQLHGVERVRAVLDPFMGLGSTAVAAIRLGVNVYGFEIDPEYFDSAAGRIDEVIRGISPSAQLPIFSQAQP